MPRKRKSLTKEEIDKIAEFQWADLNDIMNIGAIGKNKARNVLNILSNKFYENKETVHNGLVPMDMVLEYFGIPKRKRDVIYE